MIVYAVIIERREANSDLSEPYRYVAGVYDNYDLARTAGQVECTWRNNEYQFTVCDFVVNHINETKMSFFKEKV
jgi:hypothetical protein